MFVLHRRNNTSGDSRTLYPVDIVGFCVAGAIVIGLAIWMFTTLARRHTKAEMKSRNGTSLSVQGIVKEGMQTRSEKVLFNAQIRSQKFSRQQIDNSVTLPDKVLQRRSKCFTSIDVIDYRHQPGTFPKPFSFALSASPSRDQRFSASIHDSIFNVTTNKSRFSAFSINSCVNKNPTTGTAHQVKRVFEPILPDELLIRVGESLTLVQSFEDGWCLVGRENNLFVSTPKCLFRPNTITGDGIELGVVPAWCFIRPTLGLHAERPIRNTSLGITVQLNSHEAAPRDNVVSWSHL